MLKYRNTIIMVLVLAALIGFAYYNDQQQQQAALNPTPGPTAPPEPLVLDQKSADVTQIAVTTPFSRTVARYSGDKWQMVEPSAEEADGMRLGGLVIAFARISATRALTGTPSNLGPFGLVTGTLTLTLQFQDNHSDVLRFGNAVVGGSGYYVQHVGDPKIYIVTSQTYGDAQGLLTMLPKKPTPAPTVPPASTAAPVPSGAPQGPPLPPTPTP